MRLAVLFAAALVVSSAGACINDRDTLAFETRNIDALKRVHSEKDLAKRTAAIQEIALKAIGGRFERFPPKYYEMRIARLETKSSLTAHEYDDLAVAYERLGKTEKAISILLKSKSLRTTKDDQYRFHANYGTFLVHKWLANPKRGEQLSDLKSSISEIEQALKINPDSHFGREKVQLWLEKEWLSHPTGSYAMGDDSKISNEDLVVGLSGIAMMGLGYELPDIYYILASAPLTREAEVSLLPGFSVQRASELWASGKKPVLGFAPEVDDFEITSEYKSLRADGERVHQLRLAYLEERMARGEHPDTHPEFWKDWVEPPMPVLNVVEGEGRLFVSWVENGLLGIAIGAGLIVVILVGVRALRRAQTLKS